MGKAKTDESVEKLVADYEGEWMALTVTERDDEGTPTRADLVAHSPRSAEVYEAIKAKGLTEVCILYAGDLLPPGRHFVL